MYKVLSIEAWRYDEGWTWNSWHCIDEIDIDINNDTVCHKYLLAQIGSRARKRFQLEDDGYNLVLVDTKSHYKPICAIEYGNVD